jgi:excisionase family DNA binding protein
MKPPVSVVSDSAEDELTSAAAAQLLHVSRSHVNELADTGHLGEVRRTAEGHRRIAKAAVLQYKAASKERQAKGLDAMVKASERLGLYDQELSCVSIRSNHARR